MTTDLHSFADTDFCYLTTTGRVSGKPPHYRNLVCSA